MKKTFIVTVMLFCIIFLVACKPQMVTVSFNTHGGTEISSIEVKKGNIIDLPFVEKEGHYLEGWYYDSNYQKSFDNRINRNTTLHARWEKKRYHLNFMRLDDTVIVSQLYDSQVMNPPLTSYTDQVIYDWYYDASYTQRVTFPFNMPAEDLIIYAKIEDKKTLISSMANEIFTKDRLYASFNVNHLSDDVIPSTHFLFEQSGKDYLMQYIQNDYMLIYYASFQDQMIYTINPRISFCWMDLYHENFIHNQTFYQHTLIIKDMLMDGSLFDYDTYYLRLKEAYLLPFSNLYLDRNDEISQISDFIVDISYSIYTGIAIEVNFYNVLYDESVTYFYTAIGSHQMSEIDLRTCQIN